MATKRPRNKPNTATVDRHRVKKHRATKPTRLVTTAQSTPSWYAVSRADNERLLTLWQSGARLRESQRRYVWQWFDDLCTRRIACQMRTTMTTQRQRQRQSQSAADHHTDRIVLAMEFFRCHNDRQIGWCMMAYRMRFARMETLRYLRNIGIRESTVLQVDGAVNRRYTLLLKIVRQDYTMRGACDVTDVVNRYRSMVPISKQHTIDEVVRQAYCLVNALAVYYPVVHLDDITRITVGLQQDNTGAVDYDERD